MPDGHGLMAWSLMVLCLSTVSTQRPRNWCAIQKQILNNCNSATPTQIANSQKRKHKLAQNWLGCTATKQCAPKSKIHRDDLVQQVQGLCLFAVHEHGWKAKAKAVRIHGFLHHEVACWYEPDVGMKLVRNWNGLVTCVPWPMLIKSNHYVDVSHLVVS